MSFKRSIRRQSAMQRPAFQLRATGRALSFASVTDLNQYQPIARFRRLLLCHISPELPAWDANVPTDVRAYLNWLLLMSLAKRPGLSETFLQ